jgi:hypothetical protein
MPEIGTSRKGDSDMIGRSAQRAASQRKPKASKFYIISYSFAHKLADFEIENLDVLLATSRALHPPSSGFSAAGALYPPPGRRGFPAYTEKPRVVIGKRKSGPPPSDIELYHSYWLISDRLKSVFEAVDPPAFAFQACDVKLRDGSPGPVYWLCDVVRVLEAFGEPTLQEIQRYRQRTGLRYRGFLIIRETLVFNESNIGNSHIFRTPYSYDDVFCDQTMKDACKTAGIKGVKFYDCSQKKKPVAIPPLAPAAKAQSGSPSLQDLSVKLLSLGDNAKAISLAVAARSALRTIPLLDRLSWDKPLRKQMRAGLGRPRMSNSAIVLGTFRSAATAWVAALFPAFGMSDHFHDIMHQARMAGGAEDAGKTAASSAPAAAHTAMLAAIRVFSRRLSESANADAGTREYSARNAGQTTAIAAHGFMVAYDPPAAERFYASRDPHWIASRKLSESERVIWDAAWDDVRRWERTGEDAQSPLMQPLWLTPAPQYVRDDWRTLSARLLGRNDEHWHVWIDWYEARLAGGGDLSERNEVARVSVPNQVWTEGAAVANGHLSRLIV